MYRLYHVDVKELTTDLYFSVQISGTNTSMIIIRRPTRVWVWVCVGVCLLKVHLAQL